MNVRQIMDKILLFVMGFLLMVRMTGGRELTALAYLTVALTAILFWLENPSEAGQEDENVLRLRRWCGWILQLIPVVAAIFYPPAAITIACVSYDMILTHNWAGLVFSALAVLNTYYQDVAPLVIAGIFVLIVMAAYMATSSMRYVKLFREYHRTRDDSEEKKDRLKKQNRELERARDAEIYTAQLSERNRIAREIHDNVGHMLSRALLQMGALLSIHKEEPLHSQLSGVRETLDSAMTNIRSSVHDLHDESIDVEENIRTMTAPLEEKFNVRLDLDIEEKNMPRPVKYAVLGIIKEAVSNITKHSRGDVVEVHLIQHPAMYQLVVHDYSEGDTGLQEQSGRAALKKKNQSDSAADPGIGLENMRARAESVGGSMRISQENGFRIFVTIPRDETGRN